MAVNLYNSTVQDGLFNILGGVFIAQNDINTARGNTLPNDLVRLLTWFNTIAPNPGLESTISNVGDSLSSFQSGSVSSQSTLQAFAKNFVVETVSLDRTQPDRTLKTALQYIITQMRATSQSINRSTLSLSVTAGSSNSGNGVILTSTKRGDGLVQENSLSETLTVAPTSASLTAGLQFTGPARASSALGQDWPLGSGTTATITAIDANSSSLLLNGGMETQATLPNVPDSWILSVGTPGTHCLMTVQSQQTVTISGTPTGGGYLLTYQDRDGKNQTTSLIAYNATAATVQTALRLLNGLSQVTVTSSGSTPNYTHTVVFTGAGGAVPLLVKTNLLSGGSSPNVAIAITVVGTPQVFAGGAAVKLASDGSTLTTLNQRLTNLSTSTAYAISLWACADFVPAAGVVTIDLVDGIGGTVLTDAQGTSNSITFNASALLSSYKHLKDLQSSECYFRTPATLPTNVYLRVRVSTAVTSGSSIFIDQVGLTAATALYTGGPMVAIFSGNTSFSTADTWTMIVTNNRAGTLREMLERNFSLSSLDLLFPTSASPTVPDSVLTAYTGQLNFVIATNSQYLPLLYG